MNLAVGRVHCEAVLPECTELALAGLELGLPELKEYAPTYYGYTFTSSRFRGLLAP